MKKKAIIGYFISMLIACGCMLLFSYKQSKAAANQECTSGEKCEQQKTQADLILLESISKHLLSATDN
jgi:hypothetical protein